MQETRKRLFYLDLMKFIALFLMVLIHTMGAPSWFIQGYPPVTDGVNLLTAVLYIITPVTFLFCMGASMLLTGHNSARDFAHRGLKLIGIFLLLNLLRLIPLDTVQFLAAGGTFAEYAALFLKDLFLSDVLMFAGLAFLFFALMKKLHASNWAILAIALCCTIGQMFIPEISIDAAGEMTTVLLGSIFYTSEYYSYFPFLSWIIIPVLGYLYSDAAGKTSSKNQFHAKLGLAAVVFFSVLLAVTLLSGIFEPRYLLWGWLGFRMDLMTTLFIVPVNALFVCFMYFAANMMKSEGLRGGISRIAKNITKIYCVHWVILCNGSLLLCYFAGIRIESFWISILLGCLVFLLSAGIAELYMRWKRMRQEQRGPGSGT